MILGNEKNLEPVSEVGVEVLKEIESFVDTHRRGTEEFEEVYGGTLIITGDKHVYPIKLEHLSLHLLLKPPYDSNPINVLIQNGELAYIFKYGTCVGELLNEIVNPTEIPIEPNDKIDGIYDLVKDCIDELRPTQPSDKTDPSSGKVLGIYIYIYRLSD